MNKCRMYRGALKTLICVGVGIVSLLPQTAPATEETFDTLQVGAHVFTNVTVTTKAKNYIFIHHSTGMENIRVGDLPDEIRTQLGYVPEVTKSQQAANWAKGKMADLHLDQVKAADLQDPQKWREESAIVLEKVRALDNKMCGAILGGVLLIYFFFCYCCAQICQKAGTDPGFLVWVPFFQVFPLFRAARMSPLWVLTYLFVILGIITNIVWCFKIASARGKSPLTGLCLLLPGISLLAFLYLAFSDPAPQAPPTPSEDRRTDHLMTLETV